MILPGRRALGLPVKHGTLSSEVCLTHWVLGGSFPGFPGRIPLHPVQSPSSSVAPDTHNIILYPTVCVPHRGPQSSGVLHSSLLNPQDPKLALQRVFAQEGILWTQWYSFLTLRHHRCEERSRFRNLVKTGSGVPEGKYKDIMIGLERSYAVLVILHSNFVLKSSKALMSSHLLFVS